MLTNINVTWVAVFLLLESWGVILSIRIVRSHESTPQKVISVVLCMVPVIGPLFYKLGFDAPPPNQLRKAHSEHNYGSYDLRNDEKNKRFQKKIDELEAEIGESEE